MRRIRKVGSSHFRQTFALSVAGFATILFALLLLFSKVENHVARPIPRGGLRHSADTSWRRDSSGYILSPDWDIHAPPQRRYYNWTLTEISGNPDGSYLHR